MAWYEADVVTANDYYPFGMIMPGRKFAASELYRYGFNGKENDNDVKGEGSQQDYGMRIYDPRLGRFLSVDPLSRSYPWYTPYQFSGNKPIAFVDVDGNEDKWYMVEIFLDNTNTKIEHINVTDVGSMTTNGHKEPLPQGPLGEGIQFNIQLWAWRGNNMAQTEISNLFVPPSKSNWKQFLNRLDNFARGNGGDRQSGGIAMFDPGGKGSHDLLPTSDNVDILNDAGGLISMLGGARGPEKGVIRDIGNPNKPWKEKVQSAIEAFKDSKSTGENLGDVVNSSRTENPSAIEPPTEVLPAANSGSGRTSTIPRVRLKPGASLKKPVHKVTIINTNVTSKGMILYKGQAYGHHYTDSKGNRNDTIFNNNATDSTIKKAF